MLNFDLLEKGMGIVSSPPFCMIFQEKFFSCYTLLTDQISLPLLPEIWLSCLRPESTNLNIKCKWLE